MKRRNHAWFITGTSSGMGHALARAALERGDRVVATARDTSKLDDLVSGFPDRALAVALDVRDEDAAQRAAQRAVEAFGRIDVLFNNAGYALVGSVEGTTDEQARAIFDTGFFGVLNVLRAVLPAMRRQRSGHVLNMSSIFGHMAFPATGLLSAVKQAVCGCTQAMVGELAPLGITFTLVEPGGLRTGFLPNWVEAGHTIADYEESVGPVLALLRDLPPEALQEVTEVADAILDVVDTERPPAHLVLGERAEGIIRKEMNDRLADLER